MKYYKVIALSVLATGTRILAAGDKATENDFAGNAHDREQGGFIKEITKEEYDQAPEPIPTELDQIKSSGKDALSGESDGSDIETDDTILEEDRQKNLDEQNKLGAADKVEFDGLSRNDLIKRLGEKKVSFPINASKAELYEIWKAKK